MASTLPEKLRQADLGRFAQRAAQLDGIKPVMAYWLQFYMVQQIVIHRLDRADDECRAYSLNLMEHLEQVKAAMPGDATLHDEAAAQAYCEQFALDIFSRAERAVRMNIATAFV